MLRPLVLTLLFASGACASAQDLWAPIQQAVAAERTPEAFILVATGVPLKFSWYGEHPLGAAHGRELRLLSFEKGPTGKALSSVMKGPGWALFDPLGNRIAEGSGAPTTDKVQDFMKGAGWRPLREGLEAHLRLHPEDGQGWLELAHDLATQARNAALVDSPSANLKAKLSQELQPCLERLMKIPDSAATWREPRPQPFAPMLTSISIARLNEEPGMDEVIQRLQAAVPKLLSQDPDSRILWLSTYFLSPQADPMHGMKVRKDLLEALDPLPGHPWPPTFLSDFLIGFSLDPEETFRFASAALARSLEPRMAAKLGRAQVVQALGAWGAVQLQCLLLQRKVEEANALIASLRIQSGKGWPQVSAQLGEAISEVIGQMDDEKEKDEQRFVSKEQEARLRQILREPPPADPQAPEPTTLRLALLDSASNAIDWGKLQIHPLLTPWSPNELSWQPLTRTESSGLREKHGWPKEQRWLLLQRDQVLASGPGMPTVNVIETALRGQGAPELEVLGAFIKAHPERLDARRARLAMVRPRLPNPRLEKLFLEDLESSGEPIGPLPFEPNPVLWAPVARRVGLRVAEQLQHWPFSSSAWASYASWSRHDARLQRPAALLSDLEIWPRQLGQRLPGPLPVAASRAVVEVLRTQGRFEELDAWMEALWDGGLEAWMTQWAALPTLGRRQQSGPLDRVAPEVGKMISAWGEALSKQGKKPRLAALGQRLEALRPGLSALLSGPQN